MKEVIVWHVSMENIPSLWKEKQRKSNWIRKTFLKNLRSKKDNKGKPENVLIVAGEVSGDQLAASILQKFQGQENYHFFGCGGPRMQKLNLEILFHIQQLEVIGLSEAIFKYALLRAHLKCAGG